MARHKTVPDEQVLDTIFETIMETGPGGLTFARAAKACGLSPATLVQRHGNREALVQAALLRAWDRLDAETEAADAEEAETPGGAIDLLMRLMPPETAERNATDGLLLLREDIRDPVLRARGAAWAHRLAGALGRRLSKDRAEAEKLGWQMASLWQGAHTWWAFTRKESADRAIRRALEEWVDGLR
ncbi:TetR/AcrR family transcriptional regulator [Chelativorans sp. J32]|uniref:TetR/AcrR family transcriptional regulator n=1 Tax=Chelativorans sp. J32 TaxID=935840 RepID=UPI0004845D65|nr:TetR/AcrR family transcriptional regulator [Chelativorans sp. J32]